ncbi:MAG TPA: MoaD/ThiS family protein [Candidatus Hydrogenedentes bacterium]|nr:MoaD/ThiS family protein [Candidatus Hydrogenedentota bacterium]
MLREQRGLSSETVQTTADTAKDLYVELTDQHQFSMTLDTLKVVVNEEFREWDHALNEGDTVVFIPPVAGG